MTDIHALRSLSALKALFLQLPPAPESMRSGFFRARFVGPWWLRLLGGPSVALGGLPGWQGKEFLDANHATNILQKQKQRVQALSMQVLPFTSPLDRKAGVALHYGHDAPVPWRWVTDELRRLDDNTLLCMTVIQLPLLRHLAFPFLLERAA